MEVSNSGDPDDIITLDSVSAPTQGQVSLQGRQIIYRSQTNQVGSDTFNYSIKDKLGLTSTAQVIITLTQTTPVVKPEPAPNRAPQANADRFGVSGKVPSSLAVLSNDTDPDGDKLTITNVNQPIANSGKVEIINNSIQFTPNYPFMVDWFTYSISDGRGGSSSATVQLIDP